MNSLNLKSNNNFCFIIDNDNIDDILKSVKNDKNKDCDIIELRFDYVLNKQNSTRIIGTIIEEVKKITDKKILSTIRTVEDGGYIKLNDADYYNYIKFLTELTDSDLVDVEYKYYYRRVTDYEYLLKNSKKAMILSYHDFNYDYYPQKYIRIYKDMLDTSADITKIATIANSKDNCLDLMMAAKYLSNYAEKKNKNTINILMGKCGLLSRIDTNYTNNYITYINNDLKDIDIYGQMSFEQYNRLKKLI